MDFTDTLQALHRSASEIRHDEMMRQSQDKIPQFDTLKEEAAFWDTHDTTEFEHEFEPVEVTFSRPLIRCALTVPLEAPAIESLRRLAEERRIPPGVLARLWILDRLQVEAAHLA